MQRHLGATETIGWIRKELKERFPKQRFSVRKTRLAWWAVGCTVRWSGGPSALSVHTAIDKFQSTDFNIHNDDATTLRDPIMIDGQLFTFGVHSISYRRERDAKVVAE